MAENSLKTIVEVPKNISNTIPLRSFTDKDELSVVVKHWENENNTISVHAVPTEIDAELSDFQEKLQIFYCENNKRLSSVNCFDYCVAKYLEDENWYRAQVISIDGNVFKVKFIDYGNSEVIEPEYICGLSPEFASEPRFSFKFCLSGYKVENDQSETLQEKMEEYVYSENVIVKLCKYFCSMPNACATNLLYGEVDLVEMLLTNNLVSPQYIVNNQLGDKFEATVENIVGDTFYLLPLQFAQERENLQAYLQENCNERVSLDEIDPKCLYSVKLNESWSRIYIVNINDSTKIANVKCVDYGIETEIELSKLYLLPKDLWHQPLLLHECKIINFKDAPSNIKAKDVKEVSGFIFMCMREESFPVKYPLEIQIFEKNTEINVDTNMGNHTPCETDRICIQPSESTIVSEYTAISEKNLDAENIEPSENLNDELNHDVETFETDLDEKQPESFQKYAAEPLNQTEELLPESDSVVEITSVPECELDQFSVAANEFLDTESAPKSTVMSNPSSPEKTSKLNFVDGKMPRNVDSSDVESTEKIMSIPVGEFLDTESTSKSIALSELSSPDKSSKLDSYVKLTNSTTFSDIDSAEKMKSVPECEYLESESPSESTALLGANSLEKASELDRNESQLTAEIDLSDSAESDLVAKASSIVQNAEAEISFIESDEITSSNNLSGGEVGGALQDHKVENHKVESDELGSIPKINLIEESEWDERPECDIKQIAENGNQECNILCNDSENCIENDNVIIEPHIDLASNEAGDSCSKQSELDFVEELSLDVLADVSDDQMGGKIDIYVSDIVISDGCVMLSVIPYDLHVKLMSTLGESLRSIYSKKELGSKQCSVSDLCAVYLDDIWFRGRILEIFEDGLNILLIDYGITKTVDKSSVVDLEPEHKKIPPYVVECKLASVYCPPEKAEDVKNLTMELLLSVQGTGKDVAIEVVEKGKPKQVNLYLKGQNVLFGLLSQNLVSQKISDSCLKPSKYNAKTSFINSKSGKIQLYVNLVEQLESLQTFRNAMNSSYPLITGMASAMESGVYAVLYKDTWHRGKAILSNDEILLFLVDSGETAPVDELCHLLPEHCIPPSFSIVCQLPDDVLVTDYVFSAVKEIFTAGEFSVDVNMNSESCELSAVVTDEVLLEKIKNLSSLGQSVINETESS